MNTKIFLLLTILSGYYSLTTGMFNAPAFELNADQIEEEIKEAITAPKEIKNTITASLENKKSQTSSWSWIPFYDQGDAAAQALKTASEKGITVHHELPDTNKSFDHVADSVKEASYNFKTAVDRNSETLDALKETGLKISHESIKTFLVAGVGSALAIAGIVLFTQTLLKESTPENNTQDKKSLLQQIFSSRYLISAGLIAAGITLTLKSSALVAAYG